MEIGSRGGRDPAGESGDAGRDGGGRILGGPSAVNLPGWDLPVVVLDAEGAVVDWSRGARGLLGFGPEDMVGRPVTALVAGDDDGWPPPGAAGQPRTAVLWLRRQDGGTVWTEVTSAALHDGSGEARGSVCLLRDAADRLRTDLARDRTIKELEALAATDPLTGVRNRREFDRLLRTSPRGRFAALAVDVDNLKLVNDQEGHLAGDSLLRVTAECLAFAVRGWDVLARVGGDEFGVLLPAAGPEEAAAVADRLRRAVLSMPHHRASISVGWAAGPPGVDLGELWAAADRALYAAKRLGGNQVSGGPYRPDVPRQAAGPPDLVSLQRMLDSSALSIVYEPVVGLRDGRVAGHEALAQPGWLSPADDGRGVFRTARRAGRIPDLDWAVRRAAISRRPRLPHGGLLFLNVNLTVLVDPLHGADQLLLLLRSEGFPPDRLVLELSTDERVTDVTRLQSVLGEYRREGVRFAFDGVGEGTTALETMAAAVPEFLKLGRTLTAAASFCTARATIDAVLAFARSTGATVIAAGIENRAGADRMRALGIELGQGGGLAAPLRETAAEWTATTG